MSCENLKRKNTENISPLSLKKSRIISATETNENEIISKTTLLTDLPNEILGKIMDLVSFDDLFNLEAVNKRLCYVALNVAWPKRDTINHKTLNEYSNISITKEHSYDEKKRFTEQMVEIALPRTNIKHIDFSSLSFKIDPRICFKFHMAPQLISLDLSYKKLNSDSLILIAMSCPLLEKLSFKQCFGEENIDDGLSFLFKRCKKIKYLDLEGNYGIYGTCFVFFPTGLLYLNLSCYSKIVPTATSYLFKGTKNLETLILGGIYSTSNISIWLQNLKKLRFLGFPTLNNGNNLHLDLLHLESLEMLSLCPYINIETMQNLRYCPKLKGLDLSYNELDGNGFEELKKCKSLKYCNFSSWNNLDNNIIDFVQTCKIEYLAINDCTNLAEDVAKALITECDSLTLLEVMGIDDFRIMSSILSQPCPKRNNKLKLVIRQGKQKFPNCEWCEVISSSGYKLTSHTYFGIKKSIEENKEIF